MKWYGDEQLQFSTEVDVVDRFRIRVRRLRNGVPVWHYYGVPPEVMVVLVSLHNENVKNVSQPTDHHT